MMDITNFLQELSKLRLLSFLSSKEDTLATKELLDGLWRQYEEALNKLIELNIQVNS